jgi:DNA-binding transcriptional MerR regulator
MYSIGDISKKFNLTVSTLRYYDKEGLLPDIKRNSSGIRVFSDNDINTLNVIECLKKSGMRLKDIKLFLDWCHIGNETLEKRKAMFFQRKAEVQKQIKDLEKTLDFINYKCSYYTEACKDGTEEIVKKSQKFQGFFNKKIQG